MSGDPTQDDAYAALFRPDDAPAAPPEAEAPARADAPTGRLFRSTGAPSQTEAIPALKPDQRSKLRTVQIRPDALVGTPDGTASAAPSTTSPSREARVPRADAKAARRSKAASPAEAPSGPGMRPSAVLIVVIGGSLAVGALDILLGGGLGPVWGVALVLLAGLAGARVRRGDGVYAVTAPAIAALAAVLTVAQLDVGGSAGSLFDRAVVAFFSLGDNWLWIAGATALAGLLVLVRSRRS